MKKYWRQFAEWGTGSEPRARGAIAGIRLSLGFLYGVAAALAVFVVPRIIALIGSGDSSMTLQAVFFMVPILVTIPGILLSHRAFARAKRDIHTHIRLISDITHDLRNSLAVMKMTGEVALMKDGDLSADESRQFIVDALEELDRMKKTIERITHAESPSPSTSKAKMASVSRASKVLGV